VDSPIASFCGLNEATQVFGGTLKYEARGPNPNLTDWGPLVSIVAQGFLVVSARVPSPGQLILIDATFTGSDGSYSLRVPAAPQASDGLLFLAAGANPDRTLGFLVADPDVAAGTYIPGGAPPSPRVWSWNAGLVGLPSGTVLTIAEGTGSGAARVFDYLRYVYNSSFARWPGAPRQPLIVWLGYGVGWTCGACQAMQPIRTLGSSFGGQVWMADGLDEEYWADSVTAHELGHWIMGTFGRVIGEGGQHCIGAASAPGLALSEGYATWFSSDARQDPVYVDKQGGTMFWADISQRTASNSLWPAPQPGQGVLQDIYEEEVSADLWSLSQVQGLGRAPLDAALASARMRVPPFERGYTRHVWAIGQACQRVNIQDTGESTTCLADFLDALRCEGVASGAIDLATQPAQRYPYPSQSPLCRNAPGSPATLTVRPMGTPATIGGPLRLHAEVVRHGSWPYPIDLEFHLPAGITPVAGSARTRLAQATSPGVSAADLDLDVPAIPLADVVVTADSQGPGAGFHAEARYRFGRPEPSVMLPAANGPRIVTPLGDLGRAVPIR
jgi:hypothetical protein